MSQLELLVVSVDEYSTQMLQARLQGVAGWNSKIANSEECGIETLYSKPIDIVALAGNHPKLNALLKTQFAHVEVVELVDENMPYVVELVEAKIAEHNRKVSNNYAVRDDAFMGFHAAE
ncbi:MAG: hypothetical protein EOP51_08800 [Sphingobacteriales bacterium]|nr:MAG: hypothetical protein EOP51_08800 [Sphingobacteriales bacterium]